MNQKKCTAIVLAAGQGKRMGTEIQKQFLMLNGKPVLYYSLQCFQRTECIEDVILVTARESVEYCRREIVEKYNLTKVTKIVPGGKERYDSVYEGLKACENTKHVFIHDGARPFITPEILERAREAVISHGACVVGMPAKDTIKVADEHGFVDSTPDRRSIWMVQTPQVFDYNLILEAHNSIRKGAMEHITDDAMVVETATQNSVKLVQGSYENIKITTPEDLLIAEVFLKKGGYE